MVQILVALLRDAIASKNQVQKILKLFDNFMAIWIHEFSRRLKRLSGVVVESALRACLTLAFSEEFANC